MRKILIFILVLIIVGGVAVAADGMTVKDEDAELLSRAIARSYPEVTYAARVGIAAVVLNRLECEGYPDTVSGVIESMMLAGEFDGTEGGGGIGETYRISRDAVAAAMAGADPTCGALNFRILDEKFRRDLYFNDWREDNWARAVREELARVGGGHVTVIGNVGFY